MYKCQPVVIFIVRVRASVLRSSNCLDIVSVQVSQNVAFSEKCRHLWQIQTQRQAVQSRLDGPIHLRIDGVGERLHVCDSILIMLWNIVSRASDCGADKFLGLAVGLRVTHCSSKLFHIRKSTHNEKTLTHKLWTAVHKMYVNVAKEVIQWSKNMYAICMDNIFEKRCFGWFRI